MDDLSPGLVLQPVGRQAPKSKIVAVAHLKWSGVEENKSDFSGSSSENPLCWGGANIFGLWAIEHTRAWRHGPLSGQTGGKPLAPAHVVELTTFRVRAVALSTWPSASVQTCVVSGHCA